MLRLKEEDKKKKKFILIKKHINELKLDLKINNNGKNKYKLKRYILHNDTYNSKKERNIFIKNEKRNNIYCFSKTINNFHSKYKRIDSAENSIQKLMKNKITQLHQEKKINLLDFCIFPKLEMENNTKSSAHKEINLNENKIVNNKLNIKIISNPTEVYFSPNSFDGQISKSPKNIKTKKYKYKIFLNEKKETKRKNKIKKSLSDFNINDINNRINKDIKIKPLPNLSNFLEKMKKNDKYSAFKVTKKIKSKNKEVSVSTYSPIKNHLKEDSSTIENKIINNLFTDKKKMFRSQEIIILNNLNLIYSENDKQFQRYYIKHANKKTLYGMGLTHINSSPDLIKKNLENKIDLVKDKLSLIKSIVDYIYPEIIIRRSMKQSNNYIKNFKNKIRPCKFEIIKNQKKQKLFNNNFSSLLNIFNFKKEVV